MSLNKYPCTECGGRGPHEGPGHAYTTKPATWTFRDAGSVVEGFLRCLGRRTKMGLADRNELLMNTFREQALRVMTVDEWFRVLERCDKYKSDMRSRGKL